MASEFIIDGTRFTNLQEFYDHVGSVLIPGLDWGRNLDAFSDILSWTWASAESGRPYTLIWRHADLSQERLGHAEMVRWLEDALQHCHPSNIPELKERLVLAKRGSGDLSADEHKCLQEVIVWFNRNLPAPDEAWIKGRIVFWFKESA